MNPKETFRTAEERGKFVARVLDEAKADLQTGIMRDWGSCIDGSGGYCIYEATSEADVFASLHRWVPQIDFDARQVLTLEQLLDARKVVSLIGKQTSARDSLSRVRSEGIAQADSCERI
jgi:hypothetical protein